MAQSGLNNIFHDIPNPVFFNKSLLSTEAEAFDQLTVENKEVSSVKCLTLDINACGKSLM